MITYYISGSNIISVRTKDTGSSDLTLYIQDMYELTNATSSIQNYDYNNDQNLLTFTASLEDPNEGDNFRAFIKDSCGNELWYGSIQVFKSQSIDKPNYKNQANDEYKSNVSTNEYIILDN